MSITGIVKRLCPIDDCEGWVLEVLDSAELWAITCVACGEIYTIEHKDGPSYLEDPNDEDSYGEPSGDN